MVSNAGIISGHPTRIQSRSGALHVPAKFQNVRNQDQPFWHYRLSANHRMVYTMGLMARCCCTMRHRIVIKSAVAGQVTDIKFLSDHLKLGAGKKYQAFVMSSHWAKLSWIKETMRKQDRLDEEIEATASYFDVKTPEDQGGDDAAVDAQPEMLDF